MKICALFVSLSPLFLISISSAQEKKPSIPQRPVDPLKELLIIDPAVVDSGRSVYPGAFSIGHLFDQMAGENSDGRVLMREWLDTWNYDFVVNDSLVKERSRITQLVIKPWQLADGWDQKPGAEWLPNFKNAPFRLLAIVNRLDLGNLGPIYYGGPGGAEGRLVYAVTGLDGAPLGHHFTVIFEYHLRGAAGASKQDVARQWHALGDCHEFDERYLTNLETLTRQFTDRRRDSKDKQLASEIAQVRTNEMALADSCEMREYHFKEKQIALRPGTLAETPRHVFSEARKPLRVVLRNFLKQRSQGASLPNAIKRRDRPDIPLLAGSCTVPGPDFYWETGGIETREIRRTFSRRTCNGCHARDTDTEFCHIRPRLAGQASELSKFLSLDFDGYLVEDPGDMFKKVRSREMHDRVQDLLITVHGQKLDKRERTKLVRASFGE